ncbi:Up in starvation [Emydomyces testavorans]|uniref:Up in starvation n=1 Tax=Emydomyces testavorans TaxID=2070801 RepID=A0AAF0IKG8_9EURO|nr:Up in starvation [Emydomyces testavorans]
MTTFLPVNMDHTGPEIKMNFQKDPSKSFLPRTDRPVKREAQEQSQPLNTSGTQGDNKRQAVHGASNAHIKSNFPHPNPTSNGNLSREGSSTQSSAPEDVPTHESDGEHCGSENEDDVGDSAPPSKKKKGQRFYCKDFPPCNLSFTRNNLRQHAQTVHVNEDIPGDSLAATGTRFQRQIRTDRVRAPGRARAGTGGSQGGHSRGHNRNLSTSSIASTVSSYSQTQELRRRPPPLMMANDTASRARLSLETVTSPPKTPPQQIHPFLGQSPSTAIFTPSSTTYGDTASPFYASPASTAGFWGDSVHSRRLSVPSGRRPFDASHGSSYPPTHLRQLAPANGPYRGRESPLSGPSIPQTPHEGQGMSPSESDWRRRTWHPSTGFARPASSDFWFQQSPEHPQSGYHANLQLVPNQHPPRLPGIESFDQMQQNPLAPPRREPTPMQIDRLSQPEQATQQTPTALPFSGSFNSQMPISRPQPPISGPGHRRGYLSLDMSLHRNLTKLDIRENTPQKDVGQWSQQTATTSHQEPVLAASAAPVVTSQVGQVVTPTESQPVEVANPNDPNKRHAWYNVPTANSQHQNPAVTSSTSDSLRIESVQDTPKTSVDYLATVAQNESEAERRRAFAPVDFSQTSSQPPKYTFDVSSEPRSGFHPGSVGNSNGLGRLEALVAVATSESNKRML